MEKVKKDITTLPKGKWKYTIKIECFYDTTYNEWWDVDEKLALVLWKIWMFD